jgi:hypothetical protein
MTLMGRPVGTGKRGLSRGFCFGIEADDLAGLVFMQSFAEWPESGLIGGRQQRDGGSHRLCGS